MNHGLFIYDDSVDLVYGNAEVGYDPLISISSHDVEIKLSDRSVTYSLREFMERVVRMAGDT